MVMGHRTYTILPKNQVVPRQLSAPSSVSTVNTFQTRLSPPSLSGQDIGTSQVDSELLELGSFPPGRGQRGRNRRLSERKFLILLYVGAALFIIFLIGISVLIFTVGTKGADARKQNNLSHSPPSSSATSPITSKQPNSQRAQSRKSSVGDSPKKKPALKEEVVEDSTDPVNRAVRGGRMLQHVAPAENTINLSSTQATLKTESSGGATDARNNVRIKIHAKERQREISISMDLSKAASKPESAEIVTGTMKNSSVTSADNKKKLLQTRIRGKTGELNATAATEKAKIEEQGKLGTTGDKLEATIFSENFGELSESSSWKTVKDDETSSTAEVQASELSGETKVTTEVSVTPQRADKNVVQTTPTKTMPSPQDSEKVNNFTDWTSGKSRTTTFTAATLEPSIEVTSVGEMKHENTEENSVVVTNVPSTTSRTPDWTSKTPGESTSAVMLLEPSQISRGVSDLITETAVTFVVVLSTSERYEEITVKTKVPSKESKITHNSRRKQSGPLSLSSTTTTTENIRKELYMGRGTDKKKNHDKFKTQEVPKPPAWVRKPVMEPKVPASVSKHHSTNQYHKEVEQYNLEYGDHRVPNEGKDETVKITPHHDKRKRLHDQEEKMYGQKSSTPGRTPPNKNKNECPPECKTGDWCKVPKLGQWVRC